MKPTARIESYFPCIRGSNCSIPLNLQNKKMIYMYNTTNRSLYRHVVCCVPVSCKANGVGNQLGDEVKCDPVIPCTAMGRDLTNQIKLLR